jgi:hypothetical protein
MNHIAFYVFFLVAVTIAGNSAVRIYQGSLYAVGLAIKNESRRKKQRFSSAALETERRITDRKQQLIDTLAEQPPSPPGQTTEKALHEELESLREAFDAQRARVAEEHERVDRETEEDLMRYQQRRRKAVAADIVLLVLSVAAMIALVTAALPAFS